jgi:hypothetical protein
MYIYTYTYLIGDPSYSGLPCGCSIIIRSIVLTGLCDSNLPDDDDDDGDDNDDNVGDDDNDNNDGDDDDNDIYLIKWG